LALGRSSPSKIRRDSSSEFAEVRCDKEVSQKSNSKSFDSTSESKARGVELIVLESNDGLVSDTIGPSIEKQEDREFSSWPVEDAVENAETKRDGSPIDESSPTDFLNGFSSGKVWEHGRSPIDFVNALLSGSLCAGVLPSTNLSSEGLEEVKESTSTENKCIVESCSITNQDGPLALSKHVLCTLHDRDVTKEQEPTQTDEKAPKMFLEPLPTTSLLDQSTCTETNSCDQRSVSPSGEMIDSDFSPNTKPVPGRPKQVTSVKQFGFQKKYGFFRRRAVRHITRSDKRSTKKTSRALADNLPDVPESEDDVTVVAGTATLVSRDVSPVSSENVQLGKHHDVVARNNTPDITNTEDEHVDVIENSETQAVIESSGDSPIPLEQSGANHETKILPVFQEIEVNPEMESNSTSVQDHKSRTNRRFKFFSLRRAD